MSASEKQSAAEALRRIAALEVENAQLKKRIANIETLLQGRINQPAPSPQIRRPGVIVAGRPAVVPHPAMAPLPGVAPAPEADKPPDPPKAA
jgi:hypothetical protein